MEKEIFEVYQYGVGGTRGEPASAEVQTGVFHEGAGLIIINDRPCRYKIKSKSLVTRFKIYM